MRLIFSKIYKSIANFPECTLPDFVVLTGVNGAGKSHLLEAIENSSVLIENVSTTSQVPQNQSRPIRLFNWATLVPSDSGAFTPSQITQERYNLWNELSQLIHPFRIQFSDFLRQQNRLDCKDSGLLRNKSELSWVYQCLPKKSNADIPCALQV